MPPLVTRCCDLGLEALTLYSFSTENWTRSHDEVDTLMSLYIEYLRAQLPQMLENNVRFRHLGRRDGLPSELLDEFDRADESTRDHTGLTLCLAINYGSRGEITEAVRGIAEKVAAGELSPDAITPTTIDDHLDTAGLPDPDLLIRTAGELRVSNYLLWQISYAEIFVTDKCWPDFSLEAFDEALRAYEKRTRKFGSVVDV